MLILYETPSGYALFKVLNEGKIQNVQNLDDISSAEGLQNMVKLEAFHKFESTLHAAEDLQHMLQNKVGPQLKEFLKKNVAPPETLLIGEKNLSTEIQSTLGLQAVHSDRNLNLLRAIKTNIVSLIKSTGMTDEYMIQSRLALSHQLARFRVKFSVEKVDTMIIQAVSLLDDLEKELNVYVMRLKEWYGWHFPELSRLIPTNLDYAVTVLNLRNRKNAQNEDLIQKISQELPHIEYSVLEQLKSAALRSMGTDIAEEDLIHVEALCKEVIQTCRFKNDLSEYLKNRMQVVAPNLTHLVGETIGARLIAHAGSLVKLAKVPSSTLQIYGAEKALFTALRARQNTPKYGLIYHAKLVGRAPNKDKARVARSLSAKGSLAARVDAFTKKSSLTIAIPSREAIEKRIDVLEGVAGGRLRDNRAGSSRFRQKGGEKRSGMHPAKMKESGRGYDRSADIPAFVKEEEEEGKPKKMKFEKKKKKKKKKKKSSKVDILKNADDEDKDDDREEEEEEVGPPPLPKVPEVKDDEKEEEEEDVEEVKRKKKEERKKRKKEKKERKKRERKEKKEKKKERKKKDRKEKKKKDKKKKKKKKRKRDSDEPEDSTEPKKKKRKIE